MNKKQILEKIKEVDEEYLQVLREQQMYSRDLAKKNLTNFGLKDTLDESKRELFIEKEHLEEIKSNWEDQFVLEKKDE